MYIFGYLRGPGGGGGGTRPILLSSYPLPPISMYMWNKEAIWQELNSNPKYEKKISFFSYLGDLGGPYVKPSVTKFSGQ